MNECPVCGAGLELSQNLEVGEILECRECGGELEVLSASPIKLGKAPEEQEDWGE